MSARELAREARSVPNILSLLRVATVPVLVWTLLADHAMAALVLFVAAAASDGLDGLLARTLNQRTTLGAYLDPIADKLLTLSALTALCADGRLPWWMLAVVLLRDGGIVLAALALRATDRNVPAAPTRLGKYATFFLLLTMTLAFAGKLEGQATALDAPIAAFGMLAGLCVLGASLQYFLRWRRLMLQPVPGPPRRRRSPKKAARLPPPGTKRPDPRTHAPRSP